MGWNNGYEYKKFLKEQNILIGKYRKAGMSNKQIRKMYRFDLLSYRRNRRFVSHNVSLPENTAEKDEDFTIFVSKYNYSTEEDFFASGRFGWIESLENVVLVKKIKMLSTSDVELLTLVAFEGYTQREIAERQGISHVAVGKKFRRIKKFLNIF